MTKNEVYTDSLVCQMWSIFGVYASLYGYSLYKNLDCTRVAPLSPSLTNMKNPLYLPKTDFDVAGLFA
eukprot:CAMPEP_0182426160 /NCGR_PEP_ID=MMETSP1167-20130531/12646_1 /TAXON_ID=2988 /ORGANISM="Mallomonas Sp, Strain CCMP3275" /LENGTH=67 /DNA_ID=CAMNT_0024607403 /DNA_START=538 /DNA_END=741 /DNA_ORIENTATION=-